ncbi:MAG TPA: hypothetical protein VE861_00715, partial [Gemmatimonadaceae bacterium]|nr:hypothetical protein [Gemmatimonadaceae bacterium]
MTLCSAALVMAALAPWSCASAQATPAVWDAYAVRYGVLPSFRVAGLLAGADTARRMDVSLMVWLLKGPGG